MSATRKASSRTHVSNVTPANSDAKRSPQSTSGMPETLDRAKGHARSAVQRYIYRDDATRRNEREAARITITAT